MRVPVEEARGRRISGDGGDRSGEWIRGDERKKEKRKKTILGLSLPRPISPPSPFSRPRPTSLSSPPFPLSPRGLLLSAAHPPRAAQQPRAANPSRARLPRPPPLGVRAAWVSAHKREPRPSPLGFPDAPPPRAAPFFSAPERRQSRRPRAAVAPKPVSAPPIDSAPPKPRRLPLSLLRVRRSPRSASPPFRDAGFHRSATATPPRLRRPASPSRRTFRRPRASPPRR